MSARHETREVYERERALAAVLSSYVCLGVVTALSEHPVFILPSRAKRATLRMLILQAEHARPR